MSQYKEGTVSVTQGSTSVTGLGTGWTSALNGGVFKVSGVAGDYTVVSALGAAMTITPAYAGATASGQAYQVTIDFTDNYGFREIYQGDKEWPYHLTQTIRLIDTTIKNLEVAGVGDPGDGSYPTDPSFDSVTMSGATALRLVATDADKKIVSVLSLASWIAGASGRITVTNDGDGSITLSVPLKTNAGLSYDANGLLVLLKSTGGISADASGLYAKIKASGGLAADADGLYALLASDGGLQAGASGLSVKPKVDNGLAADANGLYVSRKTGYGIDVDSDGLKLKQQLHETDASTSHNVSTWSGANSALNALGLKINNILAKLESSEIFEYVEEAEPPPGGGSETGDYYMALTGSDSNPGSYDLPWRTFNKAWSVMTAGQTLVVKDGTYSEPIKPTISGQSGNPIRIVAENDGAVTIDCNYGAVPIYIIDVDYIAVEGIVATKSNDCAIKLTRTTGSSLKRVSGSNAGVGNYHIFSVYDSSNCLLEDCAAYGSGRVCYDIYEADYTTARRCWGKWTSHDGGGGPNQYMQVYGSNNCTVENCLGTVVVGSSAGGINIWANTGNAGANNNKILGCVMYGIASAWNFWIGSALNNIYGNRLTNCVAINAKYAFNQRGDSDLIFDHIAAILNNAAPSYAVAINEYEPTWTKASNFAVHGELKNSVLMRGDAGLQLDADSGDQPVSVNNHHNTYYDLDRPYITDASAGTGEVTTNPAYNTATYGNGAYLMRPAALNGLGESGADLGAEVLYRYEDGVITGTQLWPWPMEDRIAAEVGESVTDAIWTTLPY